MLNPSLSSKLIGSLCQFVVCVMTHSFSRREGKTTTHWFGAFASSMHLHAMTKVECF